MSFEELRTYCLESFKSIKSFVSYKSYDAATMCANTSIKKLESLGSDSNLEINSANNNYDDLY